MKTEVDLDGIQWTFYVKRLIELVLPLSAILFLQIAFVVHAVLSFENMYKLKFSNFLPTTIK